LLRLHFELKRALRARYRARNIRLPQAFVLTLPPATQGEHILALEGRLIVPHTDLWLGQRHAGRFIPYRASHMPEKKSELERFMKRYQHWQRVMRWRSRIMHAGVGMILGGLLGEFIGGRL